MGLGLLGLLIGFTKVGLGLGLPPNVFGLATLTFLLIIFFAA